MKTTPKFSNPTNTNPIRIMKKRLKVTALLALLTSALAVQAAPISFTTPAAFTDNFVKTSSGGGFDTATTTTDGYIQSDNLATSVALYSVGGTSGAGQPYASDDFFDQPISIDFNITSFGNSLTLLNRVDSTTGTGIGYYAQVGTATRVEFRLYNSATAAGGVSTATTIILTPIPGGNTILVTDLLTFRVTTDPLNDQKFFYNLSRGATTLATWAPAALATSVTNSGATGFRISNEMNIHSFTAVPEPSVVGLAMVGGLGLFAAWRRRRR